MRRPTKFKGILTQHNPSITLYIVVFDVPFGMDLLLQKSVHIQGNKLNPTSQTRSVNCFNQITELFNIDL